MRRYVLLIVMLGASAVWAQEQPPPRGRLDALPPGAKGSQSLLVFPAAEPLQYPTAEPLQYPTAEPLQYPISDLEASAGQVVFKEGKLDLQLALSTDILFDFDRADLRPQAEAALEQAATLIRERTRGAIVIEGHTDSKGEADYNIKLSERRAAAVRIWLSAKAGLANRQYTVIGKGESEPVAREQRPDGSDDPTGRENNRRVELEIRK